MHVLYPEIKPYRVHRLAVDPPHELYVEESGNPNGLPVLFVHGEHDVVLPAEHSRRAHELASGSELVVLADCGHTPQLEQPERFDGLLQGLCSSSTMP